MGVRSPSQAKITQQLDFALPMFGIHQYRSSVCLSERKNIMRPLNHANMSKHSKMSLLQLSGKKCFPPTFLCGSKSRTHWTHLPNTNKWVCYCLDTLHLWLLDADALGFSWYAHNHIMDVDQYPVPGKHHLNDQNIPRQSWLGCSSTHWCVC